MSSNPEMRCLCCSIEITGQLRDWRIRYNGQSFRSWEALAGHIGMRVDVVRQRVRIGTCLQQRRRRNARQLEVDVHAMAAAFCRRPRPAILD